MLKSFIKITCRPYDGSSKTKAFIDLCLDETLVIKGMTLVEGSHGLFLSFPSSIYSMDEKFTDKLEDACIKKYNEVVNKSDEKHFS